MATSMTRLTLYVLISAIEDDLRAIANSYFPEQNKPAQILGSALVEKLAERMDIDLTDGNVSANLEDFLIYSDLGDVYQLIRIYINDIPVDLRRQFENFKIEFSELIKIRNRVMHARPLEYDDLAQINDLCEKLLANPSAWVSLKDVVGRLEKEPEMVLRLSIPFEKDEGGPSNNLPLPDFDETGFIGRRTVVDNILRALSGAYPVVTIVGEGGLGKTSLALKVAYEIIDKSPDEYEAVIFVSAKTAQLTNTEIQRIRGSINTSLGLFEAAAAAMGRGSGDPLDDLISVLTDFKVLLIIDNLETVIDKNMQELLSRIPFGSKILITTRIRLGAYEFPVQLDPMSDSDAIQLLRITAKVRSCDRLVTASNKVLSGFCHRMRNNPLHIKWFVSAVQAGKRPEEVLSDEKIFLQFCLSNVFSQVSENSRRLIRTLLALGGSYTVAELSFLTQMDQATLLGAIQELTRTNMFFATSIPIGVSFETKYELSQLARAYLTRFYPINKEEQGQMLKVKRRLVSAGEQLASDAQSNPLASSSIHCRTRSDWVIAKFLREALSKIKIGQPESALELVEKAKGLAPDFSEAYRVEAWALAKSGNLSMAYDAYERALELAPDSAITYHLFGGFLLRDMHDSEKASMMFKKAMELCSDRPEPKIDYARCELYQRHFSEVFALIEELEGQVLTNEHVANKVSDLHLQYYIRFAEHCFARHEVYKCVEAIEKVKDFYEKISHPDRKMRDRLSKALYFLPSLRAALSLDQIMINRVNAFASWVNETLFTGQHRSFNHEAGQQHLNLFNSGKVCRIHASRSFGFIWQDVGDEIYFRVTQINDEELVSSLRVGLRVKFDTAFDWRGRLIAVNIVSDSQPVEENE